MKNAVVDRKRPLQISSFTEILNEPKTCKGLYHFVQEKKLSRASDPIDFLAQEAKFYGVLKQSNQPKLPLTPFSDA